MIDIILYNRLSTRSRRALIKTKKQWGHPYHYQPRGTLLKRLSEETGMSIEDVYSQLMREREQLINHLLS